MQIPKQKKIWRQKTTMIPMVYPSSFTPSTVSSPEVDEVDESSVVAKIVC
jgi:hypothetical protein